MGARSPLAVLVATVTSIGRTGDDPMVTAVRRARRDHVVPGEDRARHAAIAGARRLCSVAGCRVGAAGFVTVR